MQASDVLLIGVKRNVIAIDKTTGHRLWEQKLHSSLTEDFINLVADEERVYAHTSGELYCLDLFTGKLLWHDPLKGYGYGNASLTLPGMNGENIAAMMAARRQHQQSAQNNSAAS